MAEGTFGDFSNAQYCKQEDVEGSGHVVIVSDAEWQDFAKDGDKRPRWKIVLSFKSKLKPLPLNDINRDTLFDLFGLDSKSGLEEIVGKSIRVFQDKSVMLNGKRVGGIRISDPGIDPMQKGRRSVKQPRAAHPADSSEDDGSIEALASDWPEGRE